jgi:hypothetical protein
MVHDWLHARAAKLAGAEVMLTRDGALSRLCAAEGLKAQWPKTASRPRKGLPDRSGACKGSSRVGGEGDFGGRTGNWK